jgi:hypothetical protein
MSDPLANPGPPATPGPAPAPAGRGRLFPFHRSWTVATSVAAAMVLLALIGVGLTTTNSAFASTYWVALVPVFGLLCIGTAWLRIEEGQRVNRVAMVRQLFHWLGTAVALGLDFYIRGTGQETGVAAGLNALLVLALGCYLAGIHLEWLFIPVGLLLTLTLVIVAEADQYLWLVFVVGGLTIAAMFGLHWLMIRGRHAAPATAGP